MPEQKNAGPWTLVIQGEGSFDNGHDLDIEEHAGQICKDLESGGHQVRSVRLAVGNEKIYNGGEWHHAHSPVTLPATSNG